MAVFNSGNLVARSAKGILHQLSELVHVCAIYLGIAVLVTIVLSMSVPSLRDQAHQIHSALLVALRPDGLKENMMASFSLDSLRLFSQEAAIPGSPDEDTPVVAGGDLNGGVDGRQPLLKDAIDGVLASAKSKLASGAHLSFANALSATVEGKPVSGLNSTQAQALRSYLARKYKIAHNVAGALINTAFVIGAERKLDPQLLLAVIAIESRYNPYAESHVGAQGLMQVMPRVHQEKFAVFEEGTVAALNPIANMWVGSQILSDCVRRRGSLEGGLACYVGATGPGDGGYGASVIAEWRRIALASGIPVRR
ncbi:MAG: lytic transglycosylase domain-containing protein [Burkholderiaceae bacterium]|nr:lytic transglycosylase domain-containing protein [Burkholderiaceae bacterium]